MKMILAGLLVILLSGCGHVSVKSQDLEVSTWSLFKTVKQAEFSADGSGVIATLGSSSSEDTKSIMAICILYPDLPGCKQ